MLKMPKKGVGAYHGLVIYLYVTYLRRAVHTSKQTGYSRIIERIKAAIIYGLVFSTATIAINYLYEKKSIGLLLINGGYALIGQVIVSTTICTWF